MGFVVVWFGWVVFFLFGVLMVVKWNVGVLQLFVGKNDKVWRCVSPIGGNPKKYSKETWNEIKKSLTTPFGRLAIMGTQCK